MERSSFDLRKVIFTTTKARIRRELVDAKEGGWITDRSDFKDYEEYFEQGLGKLNIRERLTDLPSLTAVDLMSPTNALEDLFPDLPQKDKLGISVSTLYYRRTPEQTKLDKKQHILPLVGDLLKSETWNTIDSKLKGKKVDLFSERALSGIYYIPLNRDLYNIAARQLWQRLNPNGGIILAQIPSFSQFMQLGVNMYQWKRELQDLGIGVKYFGGEGFLNNGKILFQRFPYSPNSLPKL